MKFSLEKSALMALPGLLTTALILSGCGGGGSSSTSSSTAKTIIQCMGSDTMVNLAQTWAEAYAKVQPDVSVEISGGGSGTGIAALINNTAEIANSSRQIKDSEIEKAKSNTGKTPKEMVLGFDALAVYVHKDNPLNEISLKELEEIFAENGSISKWSQLGIDNKECSNGEIILVGRQSSSGTYAYFREAIMKDRDYRLGSRDMHGSKEVVELIEHTPCAIGYSGMGYATDGVKMLKISAKKGDPSFAPTVANTLNKTYPIARPLFMYTLGEPEGAVKDFMDWCHGKEGQTIVSETGYVALPEE